MKNLLLLLWLVPLLGCAKIVDIQPVVVGNPTNAAKAQGKYAAVILGGQWTLPAIERMLAAPMQAAPVDCATVVIRADTVYEEAAKQSLETALDSVTILPSALPYQQLARDGYDAEITVRQGPATPQFYVAGFEARAQTSVAVQVTVTDASGRSERRSFIGDGAASEQALWLCDAVSDTVNSAFQQALRQAMLDATSALRSELPKANKSGAAFHAN